jgi:hypothetical protein
MDQERIYVIVTFVLDGISATMTMRDLKMVNGKRYSNMEQLREGDTVLAYWQNDQDYFEAILRRFSGIISPLLLPFLRSNHLSSLSHSPSSLLILK